MQMVSLTVLRTELSVSSFSESVVPSGGAPASGPATDTLIRMAMSLSARFGENVGLRSV